MTQQPESPDLDSEESAVYEIRLQGTSAATLRRQFPTATVLTTPTETVLFRQVEDPSELDALIARLMSMGLVLTEVHEVSLSNGPGPAREDQGGTTP